MPLTSVRTSGTQTRCETNSRLVIWEQLYVKIPPGQWAQATSAGDREPLARHYSIATESDRVREESGRHARQAHTLRALAQDAVRPSVVRIAGREGGPA